MLFKDMLSMLLWEGQGWQVGGTLAGVNNGYFHQITGRKVTTSNYNNEHRITVTNYVAIKKYVTIFVVIAHISSLPNLTNIIKYFQPDLEQLVNTIVASQPTT